MTASLLLAGGSVVVGQEPPVAKAVARIATARDTLTVQVEVARSAAERERGLMERPALGPDEGMLFVYSEPRSGNAGFWMYRTRIPLDIAFVDASHHIVALRTMQPCDSGDPDRCPVYTPEYSYQAALEVNAGYFERHGVRVGDRVELLDAGNP